MTEEARNAALQPFAHLPQEVPRAALRQLINRMIRVDRQILLREQRQNQLMQQVAVPAVQ